MKRAPQISPRIRNFFVAVTYFPDTPAGDARFDYFKKVVDVTGLDLIIAPFSGDLANAGLALFTMLYVDFLDTSGTLLGIVNSMGLLDEDGNFPGSTQAFAVDAISTMFGKSMMHRSLGIEYKADMSYPHMVFLVTIFQVPSLDFLRSLRILRVEQALKPVQRLA